ncbi:SDR family oxidoreductase [Allosphingosinicella deserti]|nr:SDR family oxidoreductase [Sphingomonas deserti]
MARGLERRRALSRKHRTDDVVTHGPAVGIVRLLRPRRRDLRVAQECCADQWRGSTLDASDFGRCVHQTKFRHGIVSRSHHVAASKTEVHHAATTRVLRSTLAGRWSATRASQQRTICDEMIIAIQDAAQQSANSDGEWSALICGSHHGRRVESMSKTILVTGAGSGFGEGAAIGMARDGHNVIATVQVSPQVMPLRRKAAELGLHNLRVERLDLTDPYDIEQAVGWDFDVLWNNAGQGESGPVWEIPIDLVRRNYEINVFLPLILTQKVVQKWVAQKRRGKLVFTSSMGGLFTPANWGTYVSTKHALEAIAEALQQELRPHGILVQTINPGAYYTGYNETMADNAFRWLDDSKNVTKRADLRKGFDDFFATPEGRLDPQEMIDRMIELVPADTGKFRNVVPKAIEDMLKIHQQQAWENRIELESPLVAEIRAEPRQA